MSPSSSWPGQMSQMLGCLGQNLLDLRSSHLVSYISGQVQKAQPQPVEPNLLVGGDSAYRCLGIPWRSLLW